MQRVNRFARFWDMIGNSGRFTNTLPMLLADAPFKRFMQLSDSLYEQAGSTWKIALKRLFEMIYVVMTETFQIAPEVVKAQLEIDYARAKLKGLPNYEQLPNLNRQSKTGIANKRQLNHV
jgi:hypothetical protein